MSGISATSLDQIVPSPVSDLAFLTYKGDTPGAQLPYYIPAVGSAPSQLGYVSFAGANASMITAPLTGTFSPDDNTFFVSTAGDDEIHFISVPKNASTSNPPTDTQQITPHLPACTPVSAGGTDAGCTYTGFVQCCAGHCHHRGSALHNIILRAIVPVPSGSPSVAEFSWPQGWGARLFAQRRTIESIHDQRDFLLAPRRKCGGL